MDRQQESIISLNRWRRKLVAPLRSASPEAVKACVILASALALAASQPRWQPLTISGVVRDRNGPVAGAVVRVRTTDRYATTDAEGQFVLGDLPPGETLALTAWAPGYFIVGLREVRPGAHRVKLELVAHGEGDNEQYSWLSAFSSGGLDGNCQNCHGSVGSDQPVSSSALPFDGWSQDAHGLTLSNTRFLNMYRGTDAAGRQSPPTRYASNRDYGRFPLRPDPDQPYFGPGYKLDFPGTAGNCAACHAPMAAVDAPLDTDIADVSGVEAEGISCDFCHKVWRVRLDPSSGLPHSNAPGVLSFEFRRPVEGQQFFAGPVDDVGSVPPSHRWRGLCVVCHFQRAWDMWPYETQDAFSPVEKESQFCAPCHLGAFWDTQIYNAFGEWLDSPYSDPEAGKTCQDCHMPPGTTGRFALVDQGGLARDPDTIPGHRMPGAMDEDLLRAALTMQAIADRGDDRIVVEITLANDNTGHHVPTDSPLRQMILVVEAFDDSGRPLLLLEGPKLPAWAGEGEPANGYFAGLPGKLYAKVLQELWTEVTPTGAYWNPTRILSDTRLAAMARDTTTYVFQAPPGEATVHVRLLFRRAFRELADQKGWADPDILMASEGMSLP